MRILVAGATGAIGKPLIDFLIYDDHEVFGITHSEERAQALAARGAHPLQVDVLEKEAVSKIMKQIRPNTVIDMLTSLPKEYTPESMQKAAPLDAKLRWEGGKHLQEAAEAYGAS